MSTQTLRRPALTGFAVGFATAFAATLLALLLPLFETLHPWLVPASVLLAPLSDAAASWNGLLTMVLAGTVNGAVYAAVVVVVMLAVNAVRQR